MSKLHERLVDEGTFVSHDTENKEGDPLGFPAYPDALEKARERSGSSEAVTTGTARVADHEIVLAGFDFEFLGGSMGAATGARLARAMEHAADAHIPFVLCTATGGARMQEGMRALIQMPKVVAARLALAENAVPFVSILGNPTTGGVLASLGALGDVTFAVRGATVGFAGPRVVERVTGRPLREGSHTAEAAFEHGLVDDLIPEDEERAALVRALDVLAPDEPEAVGPPPSLSAHDESDGWDAVQSARAADRPLAPDLARELCSVYIELRGDRGGRDHPGVVCLLGRLAGRRVLLIALDRNQPPDASAFRKAQRCMKIATRLRLPVVTLVDTPGADPAEDSEASGVAWAIAELFETVLSATVPIVSIVTGEGGSGGALAFAVGDVLLATEGSIFSVIGPELAAEILWRDSSRAPEAARLLKVSAGSLAGLGVADGIIPGPPAVEPLKQTVAYHLESLAGRHQSGEELASERQRRWRASD